MRKSELIIWYNLDMGSLCRPMIFQKSSEKHRKEKKYLVSPQKKNIKEDNTKKKCPTELNVNILQSKNASSFIPVLQTPRDLSSQTELALPLKRHPLCGKKPLRQDKSTCPAKKDIRSSCKSVLHTEVLQTVLGNSNLAVISRCQVILI